MSAFTLVMLGTDTLFTPEPQAYDPKRPSFTPDYPRGELLSTVATCLERTGEVRRDDSKESPYAADTFEVVIGPKTEGYEVADRIRRGLMAILRAIAQGDDTINILAHSRGAVESILLAHNIDAIQTFIAAARKNNLPLNPESFLKIIEGLAKEEAARAKGGENTGEVFRHLFKHNQADLQNLAMEVINHIEKTRLNIFAIDPVPGDAPIINWIDERFYRIPPIVNEFNCLVYQNERTNYFTPIFSVAEDKTVSHVSYDTIPGNHGTGSAGNNCDQQGRRVPENLGEATHLQQLLFFKIIAFLNTHGTQFKSRKEWPKPDAGLVASVENFLNRLEDELPENWQRFHLENVFSAVYSSVFKNLAAYQHFNNTNYAYLGQASKTQRNVLFAPNKYGAMQDTLPPTTGYVNNEHASLSQAILYRELGLTAESLSIEETVLQAANSLNKTLEMLLSPANMSSSLTFNEAPLLQLLSIHSSLPKVEQEERQNFVLNGFSALVEKVSQAYLNNQLTQQQKIALLDTVKKLFADLQAHATSAQEQQHPSQVFIKEMIERISMGMTDAFEIQYQALLNKAAILREAAAPLTDNLLKDKYHEFLAPYLAKDHSSEALLVFKRAINGIDLTKARDQDVKIDTLCKETMPLLKQMLNADMLQRLEAYPPEDITTFFKEQLARIREKLSKEAFKETAQQLANFRQGWDEFESFGLSLEIESMNARLEETQWALLHIAAAFYSEYPAEVNWRQFESVLNHLSIAHGAPDKDMALVIAQNNDLDAEKQTLETQAQEQKALLEQQETRINALNAEKQTLETQTQEQKALHEQQETRINALNVEKQTLETQTQEQKALLEQQRTDINALNAEKQTLETQTQEQKALHEQQETRINALNAEKQTLETQAQEQKALLEQHETRINALNAEKQTLEAINQQQAQRITELVVNNEQLLEAQTQVSKRLSTLQGLNVTLVQKAREDKTRIQNLEALNGNHAQLEQQITDQNAELERLRQALDAQKGLLDEAKKAHAAQINALEERVKNLSDAVNDPKEMDALNLITKTLLPKTTEYLAHLQGLPISPPTQEKINLVTQLQHCLNGRTINTLPSQRVQAFYQHLDAANEKIAAHRDTAWKRYVTNTLLVSSIVLTGIFPGIIVLGIYSVVTGRNEFPFWRSKGDQYTQGVSVENDQMIRSGLAG